jgi:hypothetical protein
MSDITYEKLRDRVTVVLNPRISEFRKIIREIGDNFRNLGLTVAVWYPESIHTKNVGGLDADSYVGYSRIEGRWGLLIRTIERDHETRAFVNQRVFTIESCGNVEIVVNALKKVPELMRNSQREAEHQIETLVDLESSIKELSNPKCEF